MKVEKEKKGKKENILITDMIRSWESHEAVLERDVKSHRGVEECMMCAKQLPN